MAKYRMGSVTKENGDKLTCSRGTLWPPVNILIYGSSHAARPFVDEFIYHGIRVWEQACGLREMEETKCSKCPFVEVNGKLATQPGSQGPKPRSITANQVTLKRAEAEKKR